MRHEEHELVAPKVGEEFVPERAQFAAFVELDGQTVVYDERHDELHLLDEVATVVWACCDGSGTVAAIVDDLSAAFGEERTRVDEDVCALLTKLVTAGIVVDALEKP